MISQRTRLLENNRLRLHIRMNILLQTPSINLNPSLSAIVANVVRVFKNHKLLCKSSPVDRWSLRALIRLVVVVVFVPIEVNSSAVQSLKASGAVKESGFHVMREDENVSQNVVVVVVPNVVVGEGSH